MKTFKLPHIKFPRLSSSTGAKHPDWGSWKVFKDSRSRAFHFWSRMTVGVKRKILSATAFALIIGIVLGVSPAARALFGMSRGGTTSNGGQSVRQPSALGDSAVAYYPFDSDANDKASVNRNNLTDNNTVTQAAGRTPNAGQFTSANSEYLSITDNAALSTGDIDFTFSAWVYSDNGLNSFRTILSKYNQDNANTEYFLGYDHTISRFQFSVYNGSAGIGSVNADSLGAASATTWYFIVVWHDASANTVNIQVNNGTVDSAATTGGAGDGTSPFRVGAYSDNGGTARSFWNGRIDNVGFWKRTLTTGERSWLYNTGLGRGYSELEDSYKTSLSAYWDLNEPSGSRTDSFGSNTLTDNNTVTFAAGVNQTKASKSANLTNTSNHSLSVADNTSLGIGNADFTMAGWVYNNNVDSGVSSYALSKYGSSNIEYYIGLDDTTRRIFLVVSGDGTNTTIVNGPVIKSATWYFIVFWYDSVADTANFQVNNATPASSSQSTGIYDGTSALYFGALNGSTSNDWSGRLDNFGYWKRTLTTEERTSLYNSGLGQDYRDLSNPIKKNLISWWDMDEPSGTRNDAHAYSGLNNGTVTGATATTSGKFGGAYTFDGTDDYISVSDASALKPTSNLSISLWVRYVSVGNANDKMIFDKGVEASSAKGYGLYHTTSTQKLTFVVATGSGNLTATSNTALVANTWYHLGLTYTSGGNAKIYVNGVYEAQSSSTGTDISYDTTSLTFARRNLTWAGAGFHYFNGSIDDVRIYSRELSAAEIARQFNGSQPTPIDNTASAYYKMDEASGTVAKDSSHGTNNPNPLTDNNTVTQATGRQPNAGQFTSANSEFLSKADNASLSTGDIDFSIAAWVYLDSNSQGAIVSKYNTGTIEYGLFYQTGENRFILYVSSNGNGGGLGFVFANNFGAPTTGTWYFVTAWHDSSANTINISVNNGTANSTSHTTGVFDGTADFNIGASGNGTGNFWNGRIANVGLWKKVLSSAERTSLYNGGSGKMYQDLGTDEKTSLTSYWNLNEASGTRTDSYGSNNLTDNNTVTAKPNTAYKDIDTAAQFVSANTEYLSSASNDTLKMGDIDWTVSGWFYTDSLTNTTIVGKQNDTVYEYLLYMDTSGTLRFWLGDASTNLVTPQIAWGSNLAVGTWYFIVAGHDATANNIFLSVNNGTRVTGTETGTPSTGAAAFRIGSRDITGNTYPMNGRVSNVGLWKKALSTGEQTSLYNGGAGKNYNKLTVADKDRLVSYWNLDESSGDRADSHGSNTLTDNNTVTSNSGVPSARYANAGQFTNSNSEYLSITDNASLSTGNIDFSIALWVYLDTKSANRMIISKGTAGGFGQYEYDIMYYSSADRFEFDIQNGTDTAVNLQASTLGSPATGQWYFIVAWHDATANTANIQVNNSTADSASFSAGAWDSTLPLQIGWQSSTNYMDGRIDNVGFWKRTLTSDERTALYNSGIGKSYSDLSGGDKASLVSWWDLDESEATRGDAHGGNGAYVNGPTVGKEGVFGNAYSFDGSNDNIQAGTNDSSNFGSNDFTLEAWVKGNAMANSDIIAAKGDGGAANSSYGFLMGTFDSLYPTLWFASGSSATTKIQATTTLSNSQWYHLVVVVDRDSTSNTKWYINGAAATTTVSSLSSNTGLITNTAPLTLGSESDGGFYWDGLIDDFRMYNRVLTDNEVLDHYNAGAKQL